MVMTRKKAAAAKSLQLSALSKQISSISDDEFIRQFQPIALKNDYRTVQTLMAILPDAYFEDQCQRARAVLDAGHEDMYVLLTRHPAYTANDPERENKKTVVLSFVGFLFIMAAAIYGIMNPKSEL